MLWVLFAAVGLVLLVACANVALLSVMRGLDRSVESAIRLALGSTPGRLLRQFWIESLGLALLDGVLGVGLAAGGLQVLPRLVPDFPRLDEVALDVRALWFALGVTTLAAVSSGLLPAWRGARTEPTRDLGAVSLRTLARRLWPGQPAVGQSLVVDYSTTGTYPYEVIGVVGDVHFRGPRSDPLAEVYLPHAQRSYLILNVAIRSAGDPRTLIPAVRSVLKEIDPQKPAYGLIPARRSG